MQSLARTAICSALRIPLTEGVETVRRRRARASPRPVESSRSDSRQMDEVMRVADEEV